MKTRILISLLLLLFSTIVQGQNNYDRGFKAGYKEGYCYNDFGCISPIPPITPIPLIGERADNYKDGYNRGFKRGLEDKQTKGGTSGDSNENKGSRTAQPAKANFIDTYVPADYSLLMNILSIKHAQNERNEQLRKEKITALINQVKSYYNSLPSYPNSIKDGWHKVIATDNYDLCEEQKVYVENNKVTKYVIDNWYNKKVIYPALIKDARTMIQLEQDNGIITMIDLFFLESINNPGSKTSVPIEAGKVSFWTNLKDAHIKLYFDNKYVGEFSNYFTEGIPNCGQQGTISFSYKPGTYQYNATSQGTWGNTTWNGAVAITSGGCTLHGILKHSPKESRIPNVKDKKIREILKREQAEEYAEKAYQYLSEGNSDMFLRYSMAAIRQGKNSLKLHYDRGRVYESIGDNKNARKEYKKAEKGGWKEAQEALKEMKENKM